MKFILLFLEAKKWAASSRNNLKLEFREHTKQSELLLRIKLLNEPLARIKFWCAAFNSSFTQTYHHQNVIINMRVYYEKTSVYKCENWMCVLWKGISLRISLISMYVCISNGIKSPKGSLRKTQDLDLQNTE